MLDTCPNVLVDTSSSNGWLKYSPGLTLRHVFAQTIAVAGPDRMLFGTDSSFFPRGWHAAIFDEQRSLLDAMDVDDATRRAIFGGTFDRVFPRQAAC